MSLFRQGKRSTAELADLFGVARSTVYRAPERDRARDHTTRNPAAVLSAGTTE